MDREGNPPAASPGETQPETAEELLRKQMSAFNNPLEDQLIYVKREEIWKSGLTFYKQCMGDPSKMKRNLVVNFEGGRALMQVQ